MEAKPSRPPAMSGVHTSQSPPFTLPVRYMLLGLACYGLFAIDLLMHAHALVTDPQQPSIIALTHLLTLGALLSFVMGAVYQLATVAFLIPITGVRLARWNFWLYLFALGGLWWSMQSWWTAGLFTFGCAMVISIYIYCVIALWSTLQTKVRGPILWFVASAHAYLILAVTVASLLVITDAGVASGLAAVIDPLLGTHIVLALGGFFSFLLIGFSLKLLPMFTLAHDYPTHPEKWTLILAHATIWLLIAGIWSGAVALDIAGATTGALTFANHLNYIRGVVKKRMRKQLEPPIRAVMTAMIAGLSVFLLLLAEFIFTNDIQAEQDTVLFYLWGCVTLTVMGYTYKIVPFLIWTERYGSRAGSKNRGKVPLMADLLPLRYSRPVFFCYIAGVILSAASMPLRWEPGFDAGCFLVAAALVAFCAEIGYVINPRKVISDGF